MTFIIKNAILRMEAKMGKETRHERFIRLAEKRTNNIIKNIRILGNCSNRSSYEYTKEEVDKIFNAIANELREAKAKFTFKNRNNQEKLFKIK